MKSLFFVFSGLICFFEEAPAAKLSNPVILTDEQYVDTVYSKFDQRLEKEELLAICQYRGGRSDLENALQQKASDASFFGKIKRFLFRRSNFDCGAYLAVQILPAVYADSDSSSSLYGQMSQFLQKYLFCKPVDQKKLNFFVDLVDANFDCSNEVHNAICDQFQIACTAPEQNEYKRWGNAKMILRKFAKLVDQNRDSATLIDACEKMGESYFDSKMDYEFSRTCSSFSMLPYSALFMLPINMLRATINRVVATYEAMNYSYWTDYILRDFGYPACDPTKFKEAQEGKEFANAAARARSAIDMLLWSGKIEKTTAESLKAFIDIICPVASKS